MRVRLPIVIGCLVVAAIGFVPRPVAAQGGDATVCDSTLITLVYIAEHDYGFKSAMDVSKFEKGQFKPWFDTMMAGMNSMSGDSMMAATADGMMMEATQPAMMEGTQEAMMGDSMKGDAMMASLKPGVVQGENDACTKLRAEVEGYLLTKLGSMSK